MDEQMVAIVSFEGALKREIKRLRERLANANIGSEFRLDIEVTGRVQEGEVKVTYKLSQGSYGQNATEGNSLAPTLDEFMRRYGWNSVNAPKAISFQDVPA